jgi:hypothetical protein
VKPVLVGAICGVILGAFASAVLLAGFAAHDEWQETRSFTAAVREADSLKQELGIAQDLINRDAAQLATLERTKRCRRRA